MREEKNIKNPGLLKDRDFQALFSLVNASLLAILAETFEAKDTVHLCEQGIVAADADIYAGMDVSTTLANEDVACQYILTISALGAKTLGLGITAVLGRAHTFFMGKILKTNLKHD